MPFLKEGQASLGVAVVIPLNQYQSIRFISEAITFFHVNSAKTGHVKYVFASFTMWLLHVVSFLVKQLSVGICHFE